MRNTLIVLSLLVLGVPTTVRAQGFLLDVREEVVYRLPRPPIWPHPHPPQPVPTPVPQPGQVYQVKQLNVEASLSQGIAKVGVTQTFANTSSTPMEACFIFPLPYDGAVEQMTFMVDGKEHEARLLDAKEARRIYESYIRRNQDPALVEWMGTGMFKTSVFPLPPGGERVVSLKYSQVCRKANGLTDFLFPWTSAKYTSQPIDKLSIRIAIQESTPIKNVYSPTHSVEIQRPAETQAVVTYSKTNDVPTADFRLFYDVGRQAVGASVLSYRKDTSDDGYFLLLASPEVKRDSDAVTKKTILFVVDRSGSMSGKKIEQARNALKFVLNNLREGDLFNIVAYDSKVESFRPELQKFDDATRVAALGFVDGIYAGGSTNIDGALESALVQLQDESRPSYVVFLTDGLPTAGETKEAKIVENARTRNKVHARMFSLGVGYDVNSRLLDRLARLGFGQSEYVRPDEDLETSVSKLYNRIGAPALTKVVLSVDVEGLPAEKGTATNRVYPKESADLFAGDQLVIVGRYKQPGDAKITIAGAVDGKAQSMDFPAKLIEKSNEETYSFVEKLWATRRIGEIIDEIDLQGPNKELTDELVSLSKKHGILTPYTSFLAEENVNIRDRSVTRFRATQALDNLKAESGQLGFEQRRIKGMYQRSEQLADSPAGAGRPILRAGGARGAAGATTAPLAATPTLVEADSPIPVQNVGSKTFFQRQGRWVDSALTEDQEKSARKIARFSPEYFELLDKYGTDVRKYLAIEGDVVLELRGEAVAF